MVCSTNNPAQRRYLIRFAVCMTIYIVLLLVSVLALKHFQPTGVPAYALAVLPALPIIASLIVMGIYLAEEKDEFMRNLQVQALLGGTGVTLSVVSVWGFLEKFVHAQHFDLFMVYPLFWVATGLTAAVLWMRVRS